jgi:hypothetical protein
LGEVGIFRITEDKNIIQVADDEVSKLGEREHVCHRQKCQTSQN